MVLLGALANVKAALAAGGAIADGGAIQSRRGERGPSICAVGGGGEGERELKGKGGGGGGRDSLES